MILFENFKHSVSEFCNSKKIWEIITDIEIYKNKKNGWVNLNSIEFDGNPILTYYNHEEKKGIRVIQQDSSEETEHVFTSWIGDFGDDKSFHGKELVVSCRLNEMHLEKYKTLVSKWLNTPI